MVKDYRIVKIQMALYCTSADEIGDWCCICLKKLKIYLALLSLKFIWFVHNLIRKRPYYISGYIIRALLEILYFNFFLNILYSEKRNIIFCSIYIKENNKIIPIVIKPTMWYILYCIFLFIETLIFYIF